MREGAVSKNVSRFFMYAFLIIVSFISVFPLYWMVTAATNTTVEVARGKVWFGLHAAENLKNLMAAQPLWRAMGNSFLYAICSKELSLCFCNLNHNFTTFVFNLYERVNNCSYIQKRE